MAGKFFNQRVKGSSNNNMKAYMIVGGCILIIFVVVILIVSVGGDDTPDAVIELKESADVEINSELPEIDVFFQELQNVSEDDIDIDYSEVDLSRLGSYDITITVNGEEYESTLNVVDLTAPELETQDYAIDVGQTYDAEDFVDTCSDNSNEDCIIEFSTSGRDEDGNEIDFSSYLAEGTYTVEIIASDSSGNTTTPQSATLTIGEGSGTVDPTTCRFGGSEYDSNTYILGVNLTTANNGCALDLNLYHDESTRQAAYDLAEADTEKLQKEVYNLNIDKEIPRRLTRNINPVLNTTGTGLVGYTVEMILVLDYGDRQEEIARYYLDTNGNRHYTLNTYNLP